jgi:hypothetical protein
VQGDERGVFGIFLYLKPESRFAGDTFRAIHWYYGSKNSPTMGQTVYALKTSIIIALDFSALHGTAARCWYYSSGYPIFLATGT